MAEPGQPPMVKLICGMLSSRAELLEEALAPLAARLGPVEFAGEIMPFEFTHYYDAEMGTPLYRRFAAFAPLATGEALIEAKRATNELEREFAAALTTPNAKPQATQTRQSPPDAKPQAGPIARPQAARPINLDPGYVEASKLVLASMKNFSHRIYLGRGVYGEVTLFYRHGRWEALPWTFPDYASGRYDEFLTRARNRLREQCAERA
jgi:hypothetical protein